MRTESAAVLFALLAVGAGAQDFVDLPWRVAADGRLEVCWSLEPTGSKEPSPEDWTPMFAGFLESGFGRVLDVGPFAALPLLLHGDGGAAALDESSRRLTRLGIRVVLDPWAMDRVAPDPLVDLLRVRHLGQAEVASAFYALAHYALDAKRDPFVRSAAVAAIPTSNAQVRSFAADLELLRAKRNGALALAAGLQQLPDDVSLVLGLHSAALPSVGALLAAWREHRLCMASTVLLGPIRPTTPATLATYQIQTDMPGQLPYEIAVRFGNWRVDYALIALRCGDRDRWWLHLGGAFQPERITEGLRGIGGRPVLQDDTVTGDEFGWTLRATTTTFEAWQDDVANVGRGSLQPVLGGRAAAGEAPVWAFMPRGSRFGERIGLGGIELDVRFDPAAARAWAGAACPDAGCAERVLAGWRSWQTSWAFTPADEVPPFELFRQPESSRTWQEVLEAPPGLAESALIALAWRRVVAAMSANRDGDTVRWRCELAPFPLLDLVRLFRMPLDYAAFHEEPR